jgi:hypothetical protein
VEDGRGELAGGEGVEGAETGVEFGGSQAALAVEPAEKTGGGTLAFERIAFETAGNQVAVGVVPGLDAGHDVVEALNARVGAAQTIKTMAAFAEVDGLASRGLRDWRIAAGWRARGRRWRLHRRGGPLPRVSRGGGRESHRAGARE